MNALLFVVAVTAVIASPALSFAWQLMILDGVVDRNQNRVSAFAYCIIGLLVLAWFVAAIVLPLVEHFPDWRAIQQVYERWQAVNVGMLAFTASVAAFSATQWRTTLERRSRARVASAFLPEQLSVLHRYFRDGFQYLDGAYQHLQNPSSSSSSYSSLEPPELPTSYRTVFEQNILYGPAYVAQQLTLILAELQIHEARVTEAHRSLVGTTRTMLTVKSNIVDYIRHLAVIQARVNRLYSHGRPGAVTKSDAFQSSELESGIRQADLDVDDYERLREWLPAAAERASQDEPYRRIAEET